MLLDDDQDLIHKAVGGWLREAGRHDRLQLLGFLDRNATRKSRTALRYATEHLDQDQRAYYLGLRKTVK